MSLDTTKTDEINPKSKHRLRKRDSSDTASSEGTLRELLEHRWEGKGNSCQKVFLSTPRGREIENPD